MGERLPESEIDSLLRLTRTISECVPFEEALHALIEEARKRFGFDAFAVVVLDEETEELGIKIARGLSNSFIKGYRRPIGSGVTAKVIWEERPVLMAAADRASPAYKELRLEKEFSSLLCVPIVVGGGGGVGYMQVERTSGEPYTEADLRFAQLMANLGAAARVLGHLREENERLTVIDPVTQALKYHSFLRALGRELKRAKMLSVRSAVGLLDLDNFKAYSEIHGLKAGREVLAQVADIVKGRIKEFDLVGRFGLDELIFGIFKVGDRENARGLFESIREGVEAFGRGCPKPNPLATIGGLIIEPEQEVEDFTAMVMRLRHAMHAARDRGGNQVYFVDS